MMNFIVPEDGSLESQELQYLRTKKGGNVLITMNFYKDRYRVITVVLNSTNVAAAITGNVASFTGQTGDSIKVTIDSIVYDDISLAACTSIANVASAINAAVGATVATVSGGGYLVITSPTATDDSNATIADGTSTVQTVVGDLFSVAGNRTADGHYGDLSVAQSLYLEIEFQPNASSRVYKTADAVLEVTDSVE
jgi:hypothetical protein